MEPAFCLVVCLQSLPPETQLRLANVTVADVEAAKAKLQAANLFVLAHRPVGGGALLHISHGCGDRVRRMLCGTSMLAVFFCRRLCCIAHCVVCLPNVMCVSAWLAV